MQINLKNKNIYPLMQGGMGVGISLGNLAGAVACEGAIGTISAVNIGFKEEGFKENPLETNLKSIEKEIKKARELSNNKGLVAINIMVALNDYEKLVQKASEEKVDLIVSGAGLPLNLPEYVSEDVLIAPIVSSKRALRLIIKSWIRNYNRLPDLVVVEGPLAGGHLGFKDKEDLDSKTLVEIVKEVKEYIKEVEEEYNKKIYIFAAGGIRNKFQRDELMLAGADGIQVGTPFILTKECDASIEFKEEIKNATDKDIEIINSPVGMIARAINNDFVKTTKENRIKSRNCINCLKTCNPKTTKYCIKDALNDSAIGEKGLVFSGANINELNEIVDVKDIVNLLMEE